MLTMPGYQISQKCSSDRTALQQGWLHSHRKAPVSRTPGRTSPPAHTSRRTRSPRSAPLSLALSGTAAYK